MPTNRPAGVRVVSVDEVLHERLPLGLVAEDAFADWYAPIERAAQFAVARVLDDVGAALDDLRRRIESEEGRVRDPWAFFPDGPESLTKSWTSVRSKAGREILERRAADRLPAGRLSEDQVRELVLSFPDLGRFRVIADYEPDALLALRRLVPHRDEGLLGRYPIRGRVKDYVYDLDLRSPGRGHRARQFAVRAQLDGDPAVYVEIQLMTRLQHVWDQRNHPMYEWTREGGTLPAELIVNDVALAETLHVVDQQAAKNWRRFVALRNRARRAP